MLVELRDIETIKPYDHNPRHNDQAVDAVLRRRSRRTRPWRRGRGRPWPRSANVAKYACIWSWQTRSCSR